MNDDTTPDTHSGTMAPVIPLFRPLPNRPKIDSDHPSVVCENKSEWFSDSEDWQLWFQYGVQQGWIGPIVCEIHDGLPTTREEDDEFFDGGDPCISIVRVYANKAEAQAVEANHSPSVWRK